jgi:hypothetical protein
MLGVLNSAGAAIRLAPCGSSLTEWNPGQAIDAVTATRLWASVFSLPGTILTLVLPYGGEDFLQRFCTRTDSLFQLYLACFIQHAVPTVAISQIQSDGQSLL